MCKSSFRVKKFKNGRPSRDNHESSKYVHFIWGVYASECGGVLRTKTRSLWTSSQLSRSNKSYYQWYGADLFCLAALLHILYVYVLGHDSVKFHHNVCSSEILLCRKSSIRYYPYIIFHPNAIRNLPWNWIKYYIRKVPSGTFIITQ
jgi:hypothetical protein